VNPAAVIVACWRAGKAVLFAWGSADCVCWAGDVATGMLGRDPIADLRGTYDSELSARRVMVARGWKSLGDVAGHYFEEIHVAHARTGDWAIIVNADGTETIGVVSRERIVAKAESGMGDVPRGRAVRAFRVE
jgi:hypothetical protein